ncbi:serine/threonine-protein kinase [Pseudanabaena sp. PCC 6802]|uniref:serine/threonine-protein kinase n=1 Tax=Pseudanabaena sp. PCC 6802 TaxID=118173 RepID=UPI00034C0E72|nr:serine/threonine-protein kinase [Pseudanabaena sp. PCC 6802]
MSLCINPNCQAPENPDELVFCQACGSELLLEGRYRVVKLLGGGGFGKTYEIRQALRTTGGVTSGLPQVLKVLINNQPKAVELFLREKDVLSRLHHPGIPRIEADGYFAFYPANSKEPLHCMVMEKVEGLDLQQYMAQRNYRPISQQLALEWLNQTFTILHEVHQQQFFHRDIKPANIMLRADGQLVLIDFGAAREMTGTYMAKQEGGQVTGIHSLGYTPPEQMNGQAVPQSDFFALGRTFAFLLTGRPPNDMYDPYTDQCHWREHSVNLSPAIADLIDRLMARLPSQRSQNTQAVLQELAEIDRTLQRSRATPPPTVPMPYQTEPVVSGNSPHAPTPASQSNPTLVNPATTPLPTGQPLPETVVNPAAPPSPSGNPIPETLVNPAAVNPAAQTYQAQDRVSPPVSYSSNDDFEKAKTALKSAWSEGIVPGTIALLSSLTLDKAQTAIRNGAIAGAVQGALLVVITLASLGSSISARSANNLAGNLIDILLIFGLAFGVYQKNRICAVALFAYFVFGKLLQLFTNQLPIAALILALVFGYFYFEGMRGTFSYYKLTRSRN